MSKGPYVHPYLRRDQKMLDSARIQDLEAQLTKATEVVEQSGRMRGELEARLEAMTMQHEAALEAVGKAREAALREAASLIKWVAQSYIEGGNAAISCALLLTSGNILALINKGDRSE